MARMVLRRTVPSCCRIVANHWRNRASGVVPAKAKAAIPAPARIRWHETEVGPGGGVGPAAEQADAGDAMLAIARDGQHVPRRRRHVAAKTKRAAQAAGACRNARGSASVATGQARKEAVIRQARTDGSATGAGGTACPRPGGRQKVNVTAAPRVAPMPASTTLPLCAVHVRYNKCRLSRHPRCGIDQGGEIGGIASTGGLEQNGAPTSRDTGHWGEAGIQAARRLPTYCPSRAHPRGRYRPAARHGRRISVGALPAWSLFHHAQSNDRKPIPGLRVGGASITGTR